MHFVNTAPHWHVIVNHLPLIGIPTAALVLLTAVFVRSKELYRLGFLLMILFAGSVAVVMETGEAAAESFDHDPLALLLDEGGKRWIIIHNKRADQGVALIYAVAVAAVAGLWSTWKFPSWQHRMALGTFFVSLVTLAVCLWIADAGGRIRHPEFRIGPYSGHPMIFPDDGRRETH